MLGVVKKHWFTFLCCIIAAVSALLVYPFLNAIWHIADARDWRPTRCTILASRIEHYRGNSRLAVVYEYVHGGIVYRSDRYSFLPGYTSWDKDIPAPLQAGQETVCYVDPEAPAEAVIVPTMTPALLFGLIPLVFFLLFGAAALGGLQALRRENRSQPSDDEAQHGVARP